MAEADFTLSSNEESRARAIACLEALRVMQKIAEGKKTDPSQDGWWREKDRAVANMLRAAGNPDGFVAGFIATLAEYVKDDLSDVGYYPGDWERPEAAMTDDEKMASRTRFDEVVASAMSEAKEETETARERFEEMAYQEAANLANGWIDMLPGSVDTFKQSSAWQIARHVEIIFDGMARERGGYSYTKKTTREFEDTISLACNILRNGEVEYDKCLRDNAVRQSVSEAFNRGMCLSLTGHDRNRWVERFIREREQESAVAHA